MPPVCPALVFASDRGEIETVLLAPGTLRIGAASQNGLVLDQTEPEHVEILRSERTLELALCAGEALVNGSAVERSELYPGDVIDLNGRRLYVSLKASEEADEAELPPLSQGAALREAQQVGAQSSAWENRIKGLRALAESTCQTDDFEVLMEQAAEILLALFGGTRSLCVLFEEDGRNPIYSVERSIEGVAALGGDEESGSQGFVEAIVSQAHAGGAVSEISHEDSEGEPSRGLAALMSSGQQSLGLLFVERSDDPPSAEGADGDLLALMASVISRPIKDLLSS